MSACILTPTIKIGEHEVESKLFMELADYLHDRKAAEELWALSQVKEYRDSLLNLEYDENGEPTFESFARAINIGEHVKDISTQGKGREAGVINNKGEQVKYSEASEAIDKAITFNEKESKYVASVHKVDDKYIVSIEHKDATNSNVPSSLIFNDSLNKKLLSILRSVGFDIEVSENSSYSGIFNPLNARTTVDGLKTVILIAKGQRGVEAFPEEFAHAMIAGLQRHPLVTRLYNILDEDSVQEILGDEYENYNTKYKGDLDRLKKEAAGKLLSDHIKGYNKTNSSLLSRLWSWIKEKLAGIDETYINRAINEANEQAGQLAEFILNDLLKDSFDANLALEERPLYRLGDSVISIKDLAEKSLEITSKRLALLRTRTKGGIYDPDATRAIQDLQHFIEKKKYTKSCSFFLKETLFLLNQLNKLLIKLNTIDVRQDSDLSKIRKKSKVLREIKEFIDGYTDIINLMITLPSMLKEGEVEITEKDAELISNKAQEVSAMLANMNNKYNKLRFDTVYNFLKIYWGGDIELKKEKDKVTIVEKDENGNIKEKKIGTITLEMIMKMAFKDIGIADRWVNSMASVSDPLLSLIAKAVKTAHTKRNNTLNQIAAELRAVDKKLRDSGSNSKFIFERDKKGKLTGRLISNIDYVKYEEARTAYIKELEEGGAKKQDIKALVKIWESKNTKTIQVKGSLRDRTEVIPNPDIYYKDGLSHLTAAQKEYYDKMLEYKAALEDLIPERYAMLHRAVLISQKSSEIYANHIGDPKTLLKLMWDNSKSRFTTRVDDTDSEENIKGNTILDFRGELVSKLPVYYVTPLEDTDLLSTDFTASMMAYASMTVNYGQMNEIVDVLELTRDLTKEREVAQLKGGDTIFETWKTLGKEFTRAYIKKGASTNIGDRIDAYYDAQVYEKHKKDEGTFGRSKISKAKTADSIKSYANAVGMGINSFAAIANVTMGKMQMLIEAAGGEFFNYKNLAVGKKNYYKDLLPYLAEINSTQVTSKMGLLINKFDALEEIFERIRNDSNFKGAVARILGKANLQILNGLGEHYLHTRILYALLDAYKVKVGGKEISLYDALEPKEKDGVWTIELIDGVTKLDNSAFTENDFTTFNMKLGRINLSLFGAYNTDEAGALNRYALGRLALQFRRWMPEHYNRRFASKYYDPILETQRQGYYVTLTSFIWDTMKDLTRCKFHLLTNWRNLEGYEKANIKKALTEITTFITLSLSLVLTKGEGDPKNKNNYWRRLFIYNLKRMKLETGASMPFTPDFIQNILTILQSPAAAIKNINNLLGLLKFWNIFNEIETGRYAGWSEYEKDVVLTLPIYNQLRRVVDLKNEDYMFNILNKN